jgi:spore germination cell wall hydrolase CwlJ-like protein
MIDGIVAAHRRADCVLNYAAAIVLGSLALWSTIDQHTVHQAAAAISLPERIAVTPPAAVFGMADQDQSECLAEVLYYEARGEGTQGQKAVAEVVIQRTRDRNYPHTICGVVYEGVQSHNPHCQFSFACDGALRRPKESTSWARVRRLADAIASGAVTLAGETRNAISFHRIGAEPSWAEYMVKTVQIGNHVFYRRDPARIAESGAKKAVQPEDISRGKSSEEIKSEVETSDAVSEGA